GWLKRAERLLQDVPECQAHGVLLRLHAILALDEGNVDKALGLARRTAELATRFHDRDLRSEEQTSELQSPCNLVCRLLLETKFRPPMPQYSIASLDDGKSSQRKCLTSCVWIG